jgi:hypothetical protein
MMYPSTFTTTAFFLLLGSAVVQARTGVRGEEAVERRLTKAFKTKKDLPPTLKAKSKGKSSSCEYDAFDQDDLEDICRLFQVFDNMGRDENNDPTIAGFEWFDLCDDFDPLDSWLCPSDTVVQEGICSHKRPRLNPAIRLHYCGPLLESLTDETLRESCETWCTNYVSQDRGDCCDIACEP